MISDNYVTGDNIYLRELQNFFFEVLGMMSITHYGAIGDGRRDNYGPLQVAIDDANRRGLSFLYVPYGKFIYTGELQNLIDPDTGKQRIIFMGNPHAHIVNIRTGEEIEIHQFYWLGDDDSYYTKAESDGRFVQKAGDTMTGSLAVGEGSTASGELSFAQGWYANASGEYSTALGFRNNATGKYTLAGGTYSTASGFDSVAFGNYIPDGEYIGDTRGNQATGNTAIALGTNTIASGAQAISAGYKSTASGNYSRALGVECEATGSNDYAMGSRAIATGGASLATGYYTKTQGYGQAAFGWYNLPDGTPNTFVTSAAGLMLGNGTDEENRSNAFRVNFDGTGWFSGDVYVGSTSGTDMDAGSKKLATEEYVNTHGGGNVSVVTGTYTGDGQTNQEITDNLFSGRYPCLLTITGNGVLGTATYVNSARNSTAFDGSGIGTFTPESGTIRILSTGFKIEGSDLLNESSANYTYVAVFSS